MGKKFYITTAIDYTNGPPHIGHAYEKVLADAMARYMRLAGHDVYFLTGVDQHGQKVQQSAEKAGVRPEEFVGGITEQFKALWVRLMVQPDGWVETTDPRHKRVVQSMLQQLFDDGQIYRKHTSGYYSVRQEQFLSDKDRNEQGEFGPEWGQVELREEENYYFRLSDHVEWLRGYLAANAGTVFPANRQSELVNALTGSDGIDLCISRPKSRLRWGIELPFDKDYVTFVWFDALTNYASFAGYRDEDPAASGLPKFEDLWPCDAHVIGKDILIPAHGVYWMIMLHACGLSDAEMPKFLVHGFWNLEGRKYSKSEAVEAKPLKVLKDLTPHGIADSVGADGLRYFLLAEMPTGQDADLSEERILLRYNKELADILGNLLNRTLNMARKYLDGVLGDRTEDERKYREVVKFTTAEPDKAGEYPLSFDPLDVLKIQLRVKVCSLPARAAEHMSTWQMHKVLADVIDTARQANEFIDKTAPFKLAKDPANADAVASIMGHVIETVAHLSILLSPTIPATAARIQEQLGWTPPAGLKLSDLKWGLLPPGHTIGQPQPLFPKVLPPAEVPGN